MLGAGGFGGLQGPWFQQIGHCLCDLLAALLGGACARAIFGRRRERSVNRDAQPQTPAQTRRGWWLWPAAVLALLAFGLIAVLGGFAPRSVRGFWAGATFFTTCGLLGAIVIGAIAAQGSAGKSGYSASLFGVCYMTVAFVRPADRGSCLGLPTDQLLTYLRPFPAVVSGRSTSSTSVDAANARVLRSLEQPLRMRFMDETPLEDVLKFIKGATKQSDGDGIPIYVDPIGLSEADKTTRSTIRNIDLEGIPLKTSLELCLEQVSLTYTVRDGVLWITASASERDPFYHDPFMIFGHCLLALLAAGIGAVVAPLVPASTAKCKHGPREE